MDPIFEQVVEDLEERLTKIGLYLVDSDYGMVPISEDIIDNIDIQPYQSFKDGQTKLYLTAIFTMGDVVWSDRVLNPENFSEKKKFDLIAPTETEIQIESLRENLLDWDDLD